MWPERLLQVSQAIRDSVDDSRLGSFFNLARLSEPRNLVIEFEVGPLWRWKEA